MSDVTGPWWAVIVLGAVPGVLSTGVVLAKAWLESRSKKDETEQSREARINADLDARQAAMSRRDAEALATVREDSDRYRARAVTAERERDDAYRAADKAWDLSRAWKERAHRLKHSLDNSRTIINNLWHKLGEPPRKWPNETLPALEDIISDNETHRETTSRASAQYFEKG